MIVIEMLVSVLAFWVGTAVDPLFWLLCFIVTLATLERPVLRVPAAIAFGVVRCLVLPGLLSGGVRPDWPLVVLAVAIEFWAVTWLMAHAILWQKRKPGPP